MTAGCLLGILCFVLVYGVKILNFTYDAWILNGGVDIKQHYLGFCHLRNNPVSFPLGKISTLSVPFDMAVIYTDSIPLFAVCFRLFSAFLPVHFQYFGLFGILCFALMGGLSAVLIRRLTDKPLIIYAGSLFFIMSFPVLQRLYYHTALAAQWIIILAFIIWVYTDITKVKTWIWWGLLAVLCVSIHSYFVFFTFVILLAQMAEYCIKHKKFDVKMLYPLASFCACAVLSLFAFGAFYGAGNVTKGGFGDFNGNLNGFINPDTYSSVFAPMKYNGTFEYEGFGYLGAGIFILVAAVFIYKAVYALKNKSGLSFYVNGLRLKIMAALVFVSLVFATVPRISFNDVQLINIPLPAFIKTAFGICRTNGRFIWIGTYIIILLSLYFVSRHYDRQWVRLLFAAAVIVQLFDMSGTVKKIHAEYNRAERLEPVLPELEALNAFDNKTTIIYMYGGGDLRMDSAILTYYKNMSQNTFYYARPIDDEISVYTENLKQEFLNGNISGDCLYIFRDEDYTDEFKKASEENNAVEYMFDNHIAVAKP